LFEEKTGVWVVWGSKGEIIVKDSKGKVKGREGKQES
jgi:hypothetical protein